MINNFQKTSWFFAIVPGIYLIAALALDKIVPGMVTPFFVVMGLLYMALKYRPVVMIPWAVIYTATVCSVFLIPKLFTLLSGHPYYDQYVIPLIRAGTYVMVGGLASYLCIALNSLKKSEEELTEILKNLPWPILTSDPDGKILYWNEPTTRLIPILNEKRAMFSYFDLLAPPEFHGRTITEYLKRFENCHQQEPLKLSVDGRLLKGYTQRIDWTHKKVILTILSEGEISPPSVTVS